MTFPQHLVRVTGRVVLGASLALTALCIADANPAGASRGGGDDPEIEDAGTPVTTPTTQATTTTTASTVVTPDPNTGNAGEGQDTQAPADTPVEAAADPVDEPMAILSEVAPAETPQPRASLPRTGAGSVAQEAALGLGLVGAGLAATAAGRRNRRVQA